MNMRPLIIFLAIMLLLTSCGKSPMEVTPTSADTLTVETSKDNGLHFLVAFEGKDQVQIKRRGWLAYQQASFATTIHRGDLIQPPLSGNATILCADLSVHVLDQESGSPCRVEQPALYYEGVRILNPMAPTQSIPYILHPRSTRILDDRPWLRWFDTGAGHYTVSIIQSGKTIWQQTGVTGAELRYPDDAPSLQAGISYLLEVTDEDSDMSSSQEPIKGLGFQLLSPEEAVLINQVQEEILALPLDEAARHFAQAIYFAGQGLHGESLRMLDEVVVARQDTPLIHLWRGHMFLATRLYTQAQNAYIESLTLAETTGDIEAQAQAQVGLWRVTQDRNYFDTAIALYRQLGDEQTVYELRETLP